MRVKIFEPKTTGAIQLAHDGRDDGVFLHMCTDAIRDERKSRLHRLFPQAFLPVQLQRLQASVSNTTQASFFPTVIWITNLQSQQNRPILGFVSDMPMEKISVARSLSAWEA